MLSWSYGASNDSPARRRGGCATFIVLCAVVLAVTKCQQSPAQVEPETIETPAKLAHAEPRFVAVEALDCRSDPFENSSVVARLDFGASVSMLHVRGFWARVDIGKGRCWAAARFLAASRPARPIPR